MGEATGAGGKISSDGFVTTKDIAGDMFMHSRVLNGCGFNSTIHGQKLLIKVYYACKRPCVEAARLLNE